ncbi:MAG: hypothetical protein P8171_25810 [Candidatus Thiodiazotropha sp.]
MITAATPRHILPLMPHSLRRQFLFAVLGLTLLILAGGVTAIYALHTSAATIRLLAEERLVRMQEAQSLVQHTLAIETESYRLADAKSLADMQNSYDGILKQLAELDELVSGLVANAVSTDLLDLHHASQIFRNATNVAAQLRKNALLAPNTNDSASPPQHANRPEQRYLRELHKQAKALTNAAWKQSVQYTRYYRETVQQLNETTRRNTRWVMLLMAGSLAVAWIVARWFLGHHVLGRLLQVSHSLRLGDDNTPKQYATRSSCAPGRDEIDEMAHAAELFREDRRKLWQRTEEHAPGP